MIHSNRFVYATLIMLLVVVVINQWENSNMNAIRTKSQSRNMFDDSNYSSHYIPNEINWTYFVSQALLLNLNNPVKYLCGSSTAVDTLNKGILSYPIDVFSFDIHLSKIYTETVHDVVNNSIEIQSQKTYACSSQEQPEQMHQCAISGNICPIAPENIVSALSVLDWKIQPNICRFLEFNRTSELNATSKYSRPSRIYVLGGSVTLGRFVSL